jgi:hypothetical protein
VTLLLATDPVELYPAEDQADAHGWALPGTAPGWTGAGNLQLSAGTSDPRAADPGGRGPFDPAAVEAGSLFLPIDAAPADGMVAVIRGRAFVVSNVRLVVDPTGGGVDCYVAAVTGTLTWPSGVSADAR